MVSRFFVLGGECNYLLACAAVGPEQSAGGSIKPRYSYGLVARETEWTERRPKGAGVSALLDVAEASIRRTMEELQLRGGVIRKSRAVGLIPGGREGKAAHPLGSGSTTMNREVLDEVVLRLHSELNEFAATQAADADGARLHTHGSPHARLELHYTARFARDRRAAASILRVQRRERRVVRHRQQARRSRRAASHA